MSRIEILGDRPTLGVLAVIFKPVPPTPTPYLAVGMVEEYMQHHGRKILTGTIGVLPVI